MSNVPPWWQSGILYQIYPRSFADSNGDGMGDIPGIRQHLDHLAWLGVDGVWISPLTVSPNADWGYDVADYCAIQPDLGTMEDLDGLVTDAERLGIRVLMDLVPNHTSVEHPWFVDARSSRQARHRDWYVWADPKADGSPPNNWVASFGGPAWTLDEATGQYYLHNHLAEQPDLNWWHPEVRAAFDDVLRFWWDRGIAGFRIDVCNVIVKDAELRDNPPATEDDPFLARMFGQRPVYNTDRPEVHDVLRHWRALADAYDEPRVLIGETAVDLVSSLARYYGSGTDELHLAFNFPLLEAPCSAESMRAVVEETEALLPPDAWPVWTGSNHDFSRLATKWGADDPRRARAVLVMLLCLRGTPVLYQGDEIGLGDVDVPRDELRDPLGGRYWPYYKGRDAERTPMQWRGVAGGGFTEPEVQPWLRLGDVAACNVEDQRADPGSVLHLVRDLIALRRGTPDLCAGTYASLPAPDGAWAWRRGRATVVAVNFGDEAVEVPLPTPAAGTSGAGATAAGTIHIATDRTLDGTAVTGSLSLAPWSGAVVGLA